MLTREQIEEIQGEAREKGITIKALLKEKGIAERGLRMSCVGYRNTNRQGKTTQIFFPETGAPCLQSNSNQHHTPTKRLQLASN